nr:16S rRNA (cytosine(1402)-N(4))-methyltransferase RsmH [Corynebacterium heidelbergense]
MSITPDAPSRTTPDHASQPADTPAGVRPAETAAGVQPGHTPVMCERMVELVGIGVHNWKEPEAPVIVDGTLGAGGHSEAFLRAFPTAIVVGLDRDPDALREAGARLAPFGPRFVSAKTRFDALPETLDSLVASGDVPESVRRTGVAACFFDLGVSSMQLDREERGFAYRTDAPLDMRMDPELPLTAADVVNTYSHGDLARVLKTYGDERFAGKIASAVLREREREPFATSGRLVELLYATIPAASRRTGGHPAKRTFQALRVEVNRELEALERVIPAALSCLPIGGVAVFMSYQSLEDRLVKRAFSEATTSRTPAGLPMELPGTEPEFKLLTRGAERAGPAEIDANPRAAPVRVRAAQRIRQHTFRPHQER